jgi:hypothetical protein
MVFKRKLKSIEQIEKILRDNFDYDRSELSKKRNVSAFCRICECDLKFTCLPLLVNHIKTTKHRNKLARSRSPLRQSALDTPTNTASNLSMSVRSSIEQQSQNNGNTDNDIIAIDVEVNLFIENKELKRQISLLKEENARLNDLKKVNNILTCEQRTNSREISGLYDTIKLLKDEISNLKSILSDNDDLRLNLLQEKLNEVLKENSKLKIKIQNSELFFQNQLKQDYQLNNSEESNIAYTQIDNLNRQTCELNYPKQQGSLLNDEFIRSEAQLPANLPTCSSFSK